MPKHAIPGLDRLTLTHKLSAAGVATAGAAALVLGLVPGADAGQSTDQAAVQHTQPVTFRAVTTAAQTQQATIAQQADASTKAGRAEAAVAKKKADVAKAKAEKAADERAATKTASRSAARTMVPVAATAPAAKTYADNLDGWIRESLDIMAKKGIPGSYEGIHRNVIRESAGNPQAINNWDINAINGVPSKGLLQVIAPTFQAYHVEGTSWDAYDPVANITAACNYAADKYGSMDNVNSAY
ncbi:transglycosylase SLT domain-containing protein [Streptomyces sp. NPDC048644]|uniref:transglycosylase SLT domain-containing protein n=1 Tax=Streptomyces sp. NPDC048644 TaxID=3365582 RepID=UPI003717C27C